MSASGIATLVLLWLTGLYLRLPILVAPPLAPAMTDELGLNQSEVGALTTLPVLMLALGALPGSLAMARLGPVAAVALSLVLVAVGSAARGVAPPVASLFVATAVMGLGIAMMQPALPVLVKRWCPRFVALGSAVYMNGMLMGEFVGAGFTLPVVMPLADESWRGALAFWSWPALAVAALLVLRGRSGAPAAGVDPAPPPVLPPWRQARVWKMGVLLGAASAGFFGTNAYMGSVLQARGEEALLAPVLLYFNGTQVAGSLTMIALSGVLAGRHWPVVAVACALPLTLLAAALTSGGAFTASVVALGFCTCIQLILMVSLVPQIAGEREAGSLAAGMFAVGYLLGFAVPQAGGLLADVIGIASLAWLPTGVLAGIGAAVALTLVFGHGLLPSHDKQETRRR